MHEEVKAREYVLMRILLFLSVWMDCKNEVHCFICPGLWKSLRIAFLKFVFLFCFLVGMRDVCNLMTFGNP